MTTKKISVNELRSIVKEAIASHKEKKESASDKRIKTAKDKEKSNDKDKKLSEAQLRSLVRESINNQISEMMASETAGTSKVTVPRPSSAAQLFSGEEEGTSSNPKEGDKVQLASGKEAWVAKVSGDMVFVTIDGIKMVGVPMDYVTVLDDSSGFDAAKGRGETEGEREETLDGYLDRPFLNKDTRGSLEKERGGIAARKAGEREAAARARDSDRERIKALDDEEAAEDMRSFNLRENIRKIVKQSVTAHLNKKK